MGHKCCICRISHLILSFTLEFIVWAHSLSNRPCRLSLVYPVSAGCIPRRPNTCTRTPWCHDTKLCDAPLNFHLNRIIIVAALHTDTNWKLSIRSSVEISFVTGCCWWSRWCLADYMHMQSRYACAVSHSNGGGNTFQSQFRQPWWQTTNALRCKWPNRISCKFQSKK